MYFFQSLISWGRDCCGIPADDTVADDGQTDTLTVAIAGNPNSGKTTLFNALTGARQKIGNWHGVTVERKEGGFDHAGSRISVIDLPGVYALTVMAGTDAIDERIGRDCILSGEADVLVNIVDATNLERNLCLTAHLVEMRVPMVVALNMTDVAARLGIDIDAALLARRLGCPVVPMVASKGKGIAELKAALQEVATTKTLPTARPEYDPPIEQAIARLQEATTDVAKNRDLDARWLAVKLLEGEGIARREMQGADEPLLAEVLSRLYGDSAEEPDTLIAEERIACAHRLVRDVIKHHAPIGRTLSDRVDQVVLHNIAGPIIFLFVIYLMFLFTINLAGAFIDFFDLAFGTVFVKGTRVVMQAGGAPAWMIVLLADGVGGGIRIVSTFIPIIGFLYLFLSALEDSGYMARAAFLTDRFMRAVGLPGKAFVPLIVGFGCNVPAIMAARTLDNPHDRIVTVLMAPFMSCGSRLAVYALFAAAFFPTGGQNMVFALYVIGITAAILTGMAVKRTILLGDSMPFVMELPAYHLPSLKGVLINTLNRLKAFVSGAVKIIVGVVVILSFLNAMGTDGTFGGKSGDQSALSAIGRTIVPMFSPMGISSDNWPATVGIFTGIFAKEAVVGTLDALYTGLAQSEEAAAQQALGAGHSTGGFDFLGDLEKAIMTVPRNISGLAGAFLDPLGMSVGDIEKIDVAAAQQGVGKGTFGAMVQRFDGRIGAFAYLLFILLYTPCMASMGTIAREVGGKWATFIALWTFGFAYSAAVGTYQLATFMRHPVASIVWLCVIATAVFAAFTGLRIVGSIQARQDSFETGDD